MKPKALVNAAIGLLLIALLGVLVVKTRAVDFEAHGEIAMLLRQLKQLDAEWNVDVLRSKTGLSASYDPVASALPVMEALEGNLRRKADQLWSSRADSNARILPLLERNKKLMDQKVALIERFKSQHAILRNSSRYLPLAATEALVGLDAVAPAQRAPVAAAVQDVLTQTLVYINTPDAVTASKITEGLARLREHAAPLPAVAGERVAGFAAHAFTVLKQEQLGDSLLADLAALPTAQSIDALTDAHAQEREKLLVAQQNYRWVLIGCCVLLLLALAYAGRRLMVGVRLLRKTNAALQKTNVRLKESQMHLVQSEKMSALGQMVAGIAHEINTPLAYVKGTFEVLREQVAPVVQLVGRSQEFAQLMRDPHRDHDKERLNREFRSFELATREVVDSRVLEDVGQLLQDGLHGVEQMTEIVTHLKNFSRLDRAKVSEFSVQDGLESTLVLARHLLKDRVQIRREFGQVPNIHGSPSQINQVFLNLIANAVQAFPPDRSEPGVITLRTGMHGPHMVRVEIQDNGSGIPEHVLPKIFDPFFTTKEIGQGTGMGLSISFKIVQEHGGKLLVESKPGAGTVFSILLPVRPLRAEAAPQTGSDALVAA